MPHTHTRIHTSIHLHGPKLYCSYVKYKRAAFLLYLEGDCTEVATVGMAVAVNILVARVTAWVKVGPPRAELAA